MEMAAVKNLRVNALVISIIGITTLGLLVGCGDNMTGSDPPEEPPDPSVHDSATVDFSEQHQIIRGFGGATVDRWSFDLSEEDLDRVYGNGEGQLGFTIHRLQVVSDQYPDQRAGELEHAQGATERGAKVVAAPWSPPARMKTNGDLVGGSLKRDSFAVYAEYLNDFAQYMANNGAPLYGISIQNEPDVQVNYESCDWTSFGMRTFLADHGDKITATRVMAPESYNFDHSFSDPILDDPDAAANVDIVAGHIYGGGLQPYPSAREMGKEVWMTEHLDTTTTWQANLATGKEMHDALAEANFSAYLWWYVKRFYGPLQENGEISKRGYVMAQFSKFVRPGYHRVGLTGPSSVDDVYVSAYDGGKPAIVALNMGNLSQRIRFKLQNREVSEVRVYRTTQSLNLSPTDTLTVSGNSFTERLPPGSITTFKEN